MRQGVPRAGLHFAGGLLAGSLAGCGPDCPAPSAVDGRWGVVANVLTWSVDGDEAAFPSYGSPANGEAVWDFAFEPGGEAVTITIDGQSFSGDSQWEAVECGQFSLHLFGTYVAAGGSSHAFETRGSFLTFGDALEGTWGWSEGWATADRSATGSFSAQGHVRGVRLGEGEE